MVVISPGGLCPVNLNHWRLTVATGLRSFLHSPAILQLFYFCHNVFEIRECSRFHCWANGKTVSVPIAKTNETKKKVNLIVIFESRSSVSGEELSI